MTDEYVLPERHRARNDEIQWRGLQRDGTIIFAFGLVGVMLGQGAWAMFAPLPLAFLAYLWVQHDRRIGQAAHYLRTVLEPAMRERDGVTIGWEEFLDSRRKRRGRVIHYRGSALIARILFPSLQVFMVVYGIYRFAELGKPHREFVVVTTAAAALALVIVILTFVNVKHVREK